jgi:tRNA-uridine 2-sulfurtransferase
MRKVVVGLSGGVDSSVAAYLLKKQGYDVIGLFMKNWHDDSVTISNECPWLEDSNDAMIVAEKLNIPFQTIDLSKEYNDKIIKYMFNEYQCGRTPNPDILCNREIKFDIFLKIAKSIGADLVATGHYCKKETEIINDNPIYKLVDAKDSSKDQSYFLCQLSQKQLSDVLFPLADLTKKEVRNIATKLDLVTANKKDSQGLCFIGKVKLPDFLKQQLKPKDGKIIEINRNLSKYDIYNLKKDNIQNLAFGVQYDESDGKLIGNHQGAYYYTKGQRKGLGIGGYQKPLFVIDTDVKKNIVYVGEGDDHPGLLRNVLFIDKKDEHWLRSDLSLKVGEKMIVTARIRYRQPLQNAILIQKIDGLYVKFENQQSAITQGQFVAWYLNNELLGSGVIS